MDDWPKYEGDFEKECLGDDKNGANDKDSWDDKDDEKSWNDNDDNDKESWVINKSNRENPLMVLFMMSLMTIPTNNSFEKVDDWTSTTNGEEHWDSEEHWDEIGEQLWNTGEDILNETNLAAELEKTFTQIACTSWKGSIAAS